MPNSISFLVDVNLLNGNESRTRELTAACV